MHFDVFTIVALVSAAIAASILIWYLVARPALSRPVKLALLLGIGVFPIMTAGSGNYAGFAATKHRTFCGSCHVMTPYQMDVQDTDSKSLAAIHSRNQVFGDESCYTCHADYGMFGAISTKMAGMRHVYHYLLSYRNMPLATSRTDIHIRSEFRSEICKRCHTTTAPGWLSVPDHRGLRAELQSGEVTCLGSGCHGPAHPWSKVGRPGYDERGLPLEAP